MSNSRNNLCFICSLIMMALLLIGGEAMAGSVKWDDLSSNEKSVLGAFQGEWGCLF